MLRTKQVIDKRMFMIRNGLKLTSLHRFGTEPITVFQIRKLRSYEWVDKDVRLVGTS